MLPREVVYVGLWSCALRPVDVLARCGPKAVCGVGGMNPFWFPMTAGVLVPMSTPGRPIVASKWQTKVGVPDGGDKEYLMWRCLRQRRQASVPVYIAQ